MIKYIINLIFGLIIPALVLGFLLPLNSQAVTPAIINYQGRLQNANGNLLGSATGTDYQFRFSLWDSSSGGTRLWPSSTPATTTLLVTEGVFNAQIGDSDQGFAPLDFNFNTSSKIYLQLEIYNTNGTTTWEAMSPRQPVVSAGFAINADTLDSYSAGTSTNNLLLLNSSGSIDINGGATFASRTIIAANPLSISSSSLVRLGLFEIQGGNTAGTFLGINPSSFSGNFMDFQTNSSSQFTVSATGTIDVAGLIFSGSSNIKLTVATGFVDADAIALTTSGTTGATSSNSGLEAISDSLSLLKGCADADLLKWDDSSSTWKCATDGGSGGGGSASLERNDTLVVQTSTVIDFSTDFNITESPPQEGNITINYSSSGITRSSSTETITATWTFGTSVILSANPLARASSSLLRLGPNIIQGGDSASGTYIGINPPAFTGNFLDFQTNSSSQFRVSATGTVYAAGFFEALRVSSTNISSTNLTASGYLLISGHTDLAAASATNIRASGYLSVAGASDLQGLTFTNATGTGNLRIDTLMASGSVTVGTSTITGFISISSSTNKSVGIAGIFEDLTLNPSGGSFQFGNRMIVRNIPTGSANTGIGNFIRMIDDTSLANTVRGTEIQAYSGSNTQGVNTGLIAFGRTFGLQGISTGEAGGTLIPAGVYAELQNGTQGNALRVYSATTTTTDLSLWYHETSNFSGNALKINLGNGTGNFTGNFLNLQRTSSTKFAINATGSVVIASSTAAMGASSTLTVCAQDNCTLSTTSTGSVAWFASVDGSTSTNSIVARGAIVGNSADFGEYVPVMGSVKNYESGDLLSITSEADVFGKSMVQYDNNLAGAVTIGAAFIAGLEKKVENAVVMALAGRIPIKVSGENGMIKAGDLITASSKAGLGMKAMKPGRVLGMALEEFNPINLDEEGKVLVLINPHWYVPEVTQENLQGPESSTGQVLNTFNFDPNMSYSINNLQINNLIVGSPEKPTGVTLFDTKTKKPYCLYIEDAVVRTRDGECQNVPVQPEVLSSAETEVPSEPELPVQNSSSVESSSTISEE